METAEPKISFTHKYPRSPRFHPWGSVKWVIRETTPNSKAAIKKAEDLLEQLRDDLKIPVTGVVFLGSRKL